ncbi:P-loop NTPase fold protein [Dolichospermum sp. ST_con]|nr:P-loop NTPase fold protein [Dolichospermum sp. ST_con]MDD1418847.1 P-loop NTPase fold protein [Dolichospermum sp. ST_sed1]MDD1424785.1 P-loop NTPase fold protein [Dolichospermum sp. ST_sed9]MDD1431264.1 P-loop NTPase fold protein [Dolichospermum sp. ST_sed6]MDD1437253.1 P-loop NTPase fold protein [Dolichospermum sp. ST_sed10]MDD1440703.1 P-loop NTPase fold protein [Dolichospermum sp. ST_sed3]MDD1446494.1 P-loop NTPase fold protein [Dolichospermum sp. ST_sed8]MDD1454944.1 P-loop NTPase fol
MTNSPISPIEAVNTAINSHNPFTNAGIVKEQDVWGKGVPDVPTLNAHASNKVFQAIEFVKKSKSSQDKVTSIAITAQQGVGKTHLLSRIRHELEKVGGALFVYAGGNNYTDLNFVKYQFQQTLADSLSKTGSQEVMQWQEIAAAMANEGREKAFTPAELVKKFDKAYKKNKDVINNLQKQVIKHKSDADPYVLRAILWTLSETQVPYAIKWLSGEELAQSNADELGLPNPSKTNQDREAEALKNIQQILNLVGYYNSIVICFDEIDVKNNSTDDGFPTESIIANFVKILHDTLENSALSQGVVILTVMLPETWRDKVNSIQGGTPDRISKFTQRKPIDLKPVSADYMVQLATVWLRDYYTLKNFIPPHPLYPFEESNLREYGKNKPTVREALRWCADNFKVEEEQLSNDPFERFELAFTRESEVKIEEYIEDGCLIAEALYFGFNTLKGQTIECVMIEEITNDIKPKAKNSNFINFKIIGNENGKEVKIGVAVVQDSQFTLNACLKRLNDYHTFDLTRGCLVRSQFKIKQMKKTAATYSLLNELILHKGGENVDLIEDQIRPLVAILAIYQKRQNYKLTEEQIFDFISKNKITFDNLLLREILSDPSGNMPDVDDGLGGLFDDEDDTIPDVNDEDNLSDLFG